MTTILRVVNSGKAFGRSGPEMQIWASLNKDGRFENR